MGLALNTDLVGFFYFFSLAFFFWCFLGLFLFVLSILAFISHDKPHVDGWTWLSLFLSNFAKKLHCTTFQALSSDRL
jgi:hypothetical protein